MTCNRTGIEYHNNLIQDEYEMYLSEGDVKDINASWEVGLGVSGIIELLSRLVALEANTPPGVGVGIASVLTIEKGLMNYVADGCGVKLNYYPPAFHYWESQ